MLARGLAPLVRRPGAFAAARTSLARVSPVLTPPHAGLRHRGTAWHGAEPGLRFLSSKVDSAALPGGGSASGAVASEATAPGAGAPLPSSAEVVIVGGGVIGCSLAYNLTKLGMKDVVLVEQATLTSGTTWHAAGLIGTSRPTPSEVRVCVNGVKLYEDLLEETGFDTQYIKSGSITVARTEERLRALRRAASRARGFGLEAEVVSADRCGELWTDPSSGTGLMNTEGLVGGLWLPGDGTADPSGVTMAMARGARMQGARLFEKTRVEAFETARVNGHPVVTGVSTDRGHIKCDKVVLCAGQWSRQLGASAGVSVPLHSAEHFYIVTEPIDGVFRELPVMRDPDAYTYFRECSGGILMGGFEPNAKPIFSEGVPADFAFSLLPDDWDQFAVLYDGAAERVPALAEVGVRQFVNGPESFTTDNQYMLGEAPEVTNFFVAAGFNSSGIASGGGAGKVLAEWIVAGEPPMDVWSMDIRRFGRFHANTQFLRERTKETLGLHYTMPWPKKELASERHLRVSPLNARLDAANARWGQKFGWERPNYYALGGETVDEYLALPETQRYSMGIPPWHDTVAQEHRTTREAVSVFDQTSFVKIMVQGRDAESVLQRLCPADIGGPPGTTTYTAMLNHRGTFESDVTVMKWEEDQFLVVAPTAQGTRDFDWMRRNISVDEFAVLTDVTNSYAVLGVMGPKSRELLSHVSMSDLSNDGFAFSTSRVIDVGSSMVRANRMTYVGELGWELYCPTESAHVAFDALWAAERDLGLGLRNAGYYAIDTLRTEKAYRAWGHDLTPDFTPLEAGLGFACDFDKGDFIGREALLRQKDAGIVRKMATFVFEDPSVHPWGDEPIYRNGELVGHITTTNYGHCVGAAVGMGYLEHADVATKGFLKGGGFEIEVEEVKYPVKASFRSPYDPKNERVRM